MNILQILAQANWGGGEQLVLDLADGLAAKGHRLFIASKKSRIVKAKFAHFEQLYFLPLSGLTDIFSILRLKGIITKESIDAVHVHTFQHAFIAAFSRKLSRQKPKVILTRHLCKPAKKGRLYRWLYQQIDQLVFVSHIAEEVFLSTQPCIPAAKIQVIYNSINPQRSAALHAAPHPPDGMKVKLGFMGSVTPEKGIEVLIDSLALLKDQLPDVSLHVAGNVDKKYLSILQKKIAQLQLQSYVNFCGFQDNVADFIHTIDIGVAPSICRESFGLVLIEYMLAAKPVIASNNGAQPEIITHQSTGLLVPICQPQAIADAVLYLMNNKDIWVQYCDKAASTVEQQFSYTQFIQQYSALY